MAVHLGEIDLETENDYECMYVNWTKIDRQLYIGYALRIIKLIASIFTMAYFYAVFFKMCMDI